MTNSSHILTQLRRDFIDGVLDKLVRALVQQDPDGAEGTAGGMLALDRILIVAEGEKYKDDTVGSDFQEGVYGGIGSSGGDAGGDWGDVNQARRRGGYKEKEVVIMRIGGRAVGWKCVRCLEGKDVVNWWS